MPPRVGCPLLFYLYFSDNAFGCVSGRHDETGRKKRVIFYVRKKFTSYEALYTVLERIYCAFTILAQKLRHYFSAYTAHYISRVHPLK